MQIYSRANFYTGAILINKIFKGVYSLRGKVIAFGNFNLNEPETLFRDRSSPDGKVSCRVAVVVESNILICESVTVSLAGKHVHDM